MRSMFRSFTSLLIASAISAYAVVIDAVEYCLSKFEVCTAFAVDCVIATAKAVQHDAIEFVQKPDAAAVCVGARDFASMRRSLDASALA